MTTHILTPAAKASIGDIYRYSKSQWGLETARAYVFGLEDTFALLAKNKQIGRLRPEINADIYSFVYKKHIVFYKLGSGDRVVIVDVLHRRMDAVRHLAPSTND